MINEVFYATLEEQLKQFIFDPNVIKFQDIDL